MSIINLNSSDVGDETVERHLIPAHKIPPSMMKKLMASRKEIDAKEDAEKLSKGANPKDLAWEKFKEQVLVMHDNRTAEKYFDDYIEWCRAEGINIENLCYEFFLDFSQGRLNNKIGKIVKNESLAKIALKFVKDTRDTDKLIAITSFFERNRDFAETEGFNITLYELFYNGEGVKKDLNKAAHYLKSAINLNNTPERRAALREIYEEQNASLSEEERTRKAYEKVIADDIQFSKTDYALYLRSHNKRMESVRYFAADGEFSQAYETVNIKLKKEIDAAVEEFKKGAADSEFFKSLSLMQSNLDVLQDIFHFKEEPLTYWKMTLLYSLIGPIYALYHTVKLSATYFVGALVATIGLSIIVGIFSQNAEIGILTFIICLFIWAIILLILDIQRRRKFIAARELYSKLQPHPTLEEYAGLFSHKVWIKSSFAWTLILPFIILTLMPLSAVVAIFNPPNKSNPEIKIKSEETATNKLETNLTKDAENIPSSKDTTTSQSSTVQQKNQTNPTIQNIDQQKNQDIDSEPPNKTSQDNSNSSSNNQKESINALTSFHDNITRKDYRQAYNYLSKNLQEHMSYDGWVGGFKTTVSSTASDIKITSETNDKITINYNLKAVDNPGGTRNFNSIATVIKTESGWKIDSMSNKLKQ